MRYMAAYVAVAVTLSLHTAFTQYYCDVAADANDVDAANHRMESAPNPRYSGGS